MVKQCIHSVRNSDVGRALHSFLLFTKLANGRRGGSAVGASDLGPKGLEINRRNLTKFWEITCDGLLAPHPWVVEIPSRFILRR